MTNNINPSPGYILTKPYEIPNKIFKNLKETAGEDQISEVIEVGDDVVDDSGNTRSTHVKKGDKIIHAYTNKTFTRLDEEYRFCHFTEVHGTYGSK